MAAENSKGMITSLAVHGLLVGGLVLFSGVSAMSDAEKPEDGTFMVELVGAGTGAPGIPGRAPGLAEGTLQGNPREVPGLAAASSAELDRMLADLRQDVAAVEQRAREDARREAAEKARQEREVRNRPPTPPARENATQESNVRQSEGRISLQDFEANNPGGRRNNGNSGQRKDGNARGNGVRQIAGVSLGVGSGNSFGVSGGRGENGGPGGSASAHDLYKGRIGMLLERQWQNLLRGDGSGLDASIEGVFVLNISSNGNLSFGGWVKDPRNPLFENLVRQAIAAVGNCGPRPAGFPPSLRPRFSARPE